ncbi:MAG: T9SS type A sorting domain-containing protein [Bacteroidota bacterium]
MKKQIYALFLGALLATTPAFSQDRVGQCTPAMAEAFLDVGNVRARILNNGGLFQGGPDLNYQVPLSIRANSVYSASLWISGFVDDELRMAASRYGPFEFWPGPLDENGNPPADCSIYDKIWEIRSSDIDTFATYGVITENLQNWPWDLGAPVIDGDGIPNNYNIAAGDLPELLGDQRLWWIMNDRGNTHESSNTKPIGLEVHASAFAFAFSGDGSSKEVLPNYTFYDYKIINKSNQPLTDAYISMFADADLGNASDDYAGSDSLLQVGYVYNGGNNDNLCGRGVPPPAVGFTLFTDKLAEKDGVDNNFDGVVDEPGEQLGVSSIIANAEPYNKEMYRNIMLGLWEDERPILFGGQGREGFGFPNDLPRKETRFIFSNNPIQRGFWSEANGDNRGTPNKPGDRNVVTSMGSFDFAPAEKINFRMAIVWSQAGTNLQSVDLLLRETASLRAKSDALFGIEQRAEESATDSPIESESTFSPDVHSNYPNPFTEQTTINYTLQHSMAVRLSVFDMLGREVQNLVNQQQDAGNYTVDFNAGDLPAGIYFARIQLDGNQFTRRMTLIR